MNNEHATTRIALDVIFGTDIDLVPLIEYTRSEKPHLGVFALAWAAILTHEPHRMTGFELAKTLKKITDREVSEGGPYYTNIETKTIHTDVNAAIGLMLAKLEVELPNLRTYVQEHRTDPLSFIPDKTAFERILNIWLNDNLKHAPEPETATFTAEEESIVRLMLDHAKKRFERFEPDYTNRALSVIEQTIRKNTDKQMSLMAWYAKKAAASDVSDKFIAEAGLANTLFWTAFIIYDDFWDEDESADPKLLPVANTFAREYVSFFSSLFPETKFSRLFHTYMDKLDEANHWETVSCRAMISNNTLEIPKVIPNYGDYSKKFAPSSGHMFGPLAVLIKSRVGIDSDDMRNAIEYFSGYLIAMQINDDIHDWVEDLQRGTLSTVVAPLISEYAKRNPDAKHIDLAAEQETLQQLFWYDIMPNICKTAIETSERSIRALHRINAIKNPEPLETYPRMTKQSAEHALAEQQKSVDFLNAYDS